VQPNKLYNITQLMYNNVKYILEITYGSEAVHKLLASRTAGQPTKPTTFDVFSRNWTISLELIVLKPKTVCSLSSLNTEIET